MIIDAHTHFYDPSRPQGVPWPCPEDQALYRTVLPEHVQAVAAPEGVTGTVVVEASPWIEDNQWVLDIAANDPFVLGFVGHLDPSLPEFAAHLDRFSANPLFRGIRVGRQTLEQPVPRQVLNHLGRLAEKDLELDVLLGPAALRDAEMLAVMLPELRLVLNHVACVRIDGQAPDPAWAAGMERIAARPRTYCKVSSLSSFVKLPRAPDDVAFYAPTLDLLWQAFGQDRLIFGSDWPVSARNSDYAASMRVVRGYFAAKGAVAAEKFFWRNSQAAYRWRARSG